MSWPPINQSGFAEDDGARSKYVWKLIQAPQGLDSVAPRASGSIPRVLVQFWDDLDNLPEDVQGCLNSWEPLVLDGISKVLFDDKAAQQFISTNFGPIHTKAFDRCYHPAMRSDYFRLCYILSKGGVYVDADDIYRDTDYNYLFNDSMLKIQPLCYDITSGKMVQPSTFLVTRTYPPNWIFYFNNNPLIAPARHPVLQLALERATRLLLESDVLADIQSTTGPGNLTASVVKYAVEKSSQNMPIELFTLHDWEAISTSAWPLSYRNDQRNWRLSNRKRYSRDSRNSTL